MQPQTATTSTAPASRAWSAWPVTCAITFTFGGIATDDRARVLTETGVPVPGLYAVGEIAGLYYHSYPGATSVLRARAREMGMRTLREDGIRKVLSGLTSAEEVIGATMSDAN